MDPTLSVSKGVFVFKNGANRAAANHKRRSKTPQPSGIIGTEITQQPFYSVYTATWRALQQEIETLQRKSNANVLKQLVSYVGEECVDKEDAFDMEEVLPTAALLTGINQPDHLQQFTIFAQAVHEKYSARVCMLEARECSTVKATLENMVYNLIEMDNMKADLSDEEETEELGEEEGDNRRLRRSQCTMKYLQRWYRNNFLSDEMDVHDNSMSPKKKSKITTPALVVILRDFECFSVPVLQDFILILSAQCSRLPFVLVLGVATSVAAVHNTLSYNVTNKIKLRIFQMQSSCVELNEIVEKVMLSPHHAFHLSGKSLKLLTHIFLYYDFSINGFIQGFKYCIMEHFFQGNAYALCQNYGSSLKIIKSLTHADCETIRRLLSFRPYVESLNDCKLIIDILTDDECLKQKLPALLHDCHCYMLLYRCFLEFLLVLVEDLPRTPLGKYRREVYAFCLSRDVVEQAEFKECWQMLKMLSKDEFLSKITKAVSKTEEFASTELIENDVGEECAKIIVDKLNMVLEHLSAVVDASLATTKLLDNTESSIAPIEEIKTMRSRLELKQHLLQMSKQERTQNVTEFSQAVQKILSYIENHIIAQYMRPLQRAPALHELFIFNDIETVRQHIVGSPRAAIHMALTNPHYYLQCKCCKLREESQLLPTMPDISIVYKLHLECGRLINLYDWLQAFRTVVEPIENDEQVDSEEISPEIQARFTRAVSELQFLGFIKMSKRKRDHAQRLTW